VPQWVKEAWVGVEIPISLYHYLTDVKISKPGKFAPRVYVNDSLAALKCKSEKCYEWWSDHFLDYYDPRQKMFEFLKEDCEIIEVEDRGVDLLSCRGCLF